MTLPTIDAVQAKRLIDEGAILVDVREADERAREHVPGSRHNALSRLSAIDSAKSKAVVFHCRSGARTAANAGRLAQAAGCVPIFCKGASRPGRRPGCP